MDNPKTIGEIINQTKEIEENNWHNTQYLNSINMLLTSDDLAKIKDDHLYEKFTQLNNTMEGVNDLTNEFLSDLAKKHN